MERANEVVKISVAHHGNRAEGDVTGLWNVGVADGAGHFGVETGALRGWLRWRGYKVTGT